MAISDYSTTPASNTSLSGIDISGTTGKVKDGDNAIRQIMADIKAGVPYLSGTNYLMESTDAGATAGPVLEFYRNSATPAASDITGKILFNGEDSAGNTQEYASIETVIVDATSTSEDGQLDFYATKAGTRTKFLSITATAMAHTGAAAYTVDAVLRPASNDGAALGESGTAWSDLFLASGGVINWNAGDVTITHSANALTFAGAASGYYFDGAVFGSGKNLGSAGSPWSAAYVSEVRLGTFSNTGATRGTLIDNITFSHSSTGTGAEFAIALYNANGLVGTAVTSGSGTAWNTSSDENLKTNFRDFDAGTLIDNLHVYHFDWKSGGDGYGVKAQEAYEVFPDAITPGSPQDEYGSAGYQTWGADYSKFVPLLLEEVQALRKRVAELEARQ